MYIKKIYIFNLFLGLSLIAKAQNSPINQTLSVTTNSCLNEQILVLQGSETNFNYFLRNDNTKELVGNPQTGTGSALNFQPGLVSNPTTYHVFGANPSYALEFNGSSSFVEIPHDPVLDFTSGLTLEAWVFPNNITSGIYHEIIRKENSGTGRILLSFQNNGTTLSFGTHTTTDGYAELDVPIDPNDYTNQWVHILAYFDDATNTMKLFRNGVEIGSKISNGALVSPSVSSSTFIGSWSGTSEFFNGKIASVRFWDRALTTAAEINQARDNLFVGNEPNLVAYYPFFENAGTQLTDSTTNTNNGIINGAVWASGIQGGIGEIVSNSQSISFNQPTVYVDASATGSNTGCNWANAFNNVQDAVDVISSGGQILIAGGTYSQGAIISINKAISIIGGYSPGGGTQDITNNPTILDGNDTHQVIDAIHTEGTLYLEGLTITRGFGNIGAGIKSTGDLYLRQCDLTLNNTADVPLAGGFGAGMYVTQANITMVLSNITYNTAYCSYDCNPSGAGIYLYGGNIMIVNCLISNNIANGFGLVLGGGITAFDHFPLDNDTANITIINSMVSDNTAFSTTNSASGGGVYASGNVTVINSLFANNLRDGAGGAGVSIYASNNITFLNSSTWDYNFGDPFYQESGTLTINNSAIISDNPAGIDNINVTAPGFNPLFVDYSNGNFRLQEASILREAGNSSYLPLDTYDLDNDGDTSETIPLDLDGNLREDGTVDIGPFEYQSTLSLPKTIQSTFKVYPNPANDKLFISGITDVHNVSIFNILGQEVSKSSISIQNNFIKTDLLVPGLYILKIEDVSINFVKN